MFLLLLQNKVFTHHDHERRHTPHKHADGAMAHGGLETSIFIFLCFLSDFEMSHCLVEHGSPLRERKKVLNNGFLDLKFPIRVLVTWWSIRGRERELLLRYKGESFLRYKGEVEGVCQS